MKKFYVIHYSFTGSGANYKRVIYVKTMEFKSVKILNKTDGLFSTQYSDPVDLLTQCLRFKFDRLEEQVKGVMADQSLFVFQRDDPQQNGVKLLTPVSD